MYLIKAVGIDLATVSSGVSCISFKEGTWDVTVLDAGAVHLYKQVNLRQSRFSQHLIAAGRIADFVVKHKPDIIGLEDYTNQITSHVSFSMGQLGGMVRLLLWQKGFRQLLIAPSRMDKFALPANYVVKDKKKQIIEWVHGVTGAEFVGNSKSVSDMADATVYALIAACFFSLYWLKKEPPISTRQKELFWSRRPNKSSVIAKTWKPNGFMDAPFHYLIRNSNVEPSTYTPEWMTLNLNEVRFIGEGMDELY